MANVLMTRIAKKRRKVKPRKAKPRIKKKKVLTPKQRSRAAKKGWKNRKKREREFLKKARLDQTVKGVESDSLGFGKAIMREFDAKPGLKEAFVAMAPDAQEIVLDKYARQWAKDHGFVQVEEDPEITAIRLRLRLADQEGNLEHEMEMIQSEYGMSAQEVYTEWLYSGVQ